MTDFLSYMYVYMYIHTYIVIDGLIGSLPHTCSDNDLPFLPHMLREKD